MDARVETPFGVILYQGPAGNSDQRAAQELAIGSDTEILALGSLDSLLETVDGTPGLFGVVPLDDTLQGSFTTAIDKIVFSLKRAKIVRSYVLSEAIAIYTTDSKTFPDVVHSHPLLLERFMPSISELGLQTVACVNTKVACESVRRLGNPLHAALAPRAVAESLGLTRHPRFETREFVVHTRFGLIGHLVGESHDSGLILVYLVPLSDSPGTLASILDMFRQHSLNMTSIRSVRMTDDSPFGFLVEFIGGLHDSAVNALFRGLVSESVAIKIVGAYDATFSPGQEHSVTTIPGLIRDLSSLDSWTNSSSDAFQS